MHFSLQLGAVAVREGLYHLELSVDDELLRSIPLPVVVVGEQLTLGSGEWPQDNAGIINAQVGEIAGNPRKTRRPPPPQKKTKRRR